MKTFFRYLRFNLKRSTLRSISLMLCSVLIVLVALPSMIEPDKYEYVHTSEPGVHYTYFYNNCTTGMQLLLMILCILSTVMPILCLADLKNRRNTDTLYSLPISRLKLSLVYFISGFIQVVFIYSCVFFTAYTFLALNTDIFDLSYMLIYYPLSLLAALLIYSFFAFFFTTANTVFDGIAFGVIWIFILSYAVENISLHYELDSISTYWTFIYMPLYNLTVIFRKKAEINYAGDLRFSDYDNIIDSSYMFAVWAAVGLLCIIGYLVVFARKKQNNAGEISDSIFGYKLLIPLLSTIYYIDYYSSSIIFLAVASFVMYIIYRRSFKLKKQDYIVWALTIAINLLNDIL